MDRTIGLILARGGSVGLKRKNLAYLHGKTLLGRGINTLQEGGVKSIWVSTEDEKIAEEASRCGSHVIFRPKELATSTSLALDAMRHAVKEIQLRGTTIGTIVNLQLTHPMLTPFDVALALKQFHEGKADIVMTVWPVDNVFLDRHGRHLNYDVKGSTNRQEREQSYKETGLFVFDVAYLDGLWLDGTIGIVPSAREPIDIHTEKDLEHANLALHRIESRRT